MQKVEEREGKGLVDDGKVSENLGDGEVVGHAPSSSTLIGGLPLSCWVCAVGVHAGDAVAVPLAVECLSGPCDAVEGCHELPIGEKGAGRKGGGAAKLVMELGQRARLPERDPSRGSSALHA